MIARGSQKWGWGEVEVGKGDKWGERDLALGGKHTRQCADDVLLGCTLETCVVFKPMSPQ